MKETRNELRCFCRRTPLLALYGLNRRGKIYIHFKVWKNRRLFCEMLVTEGKVQVRCRECLRWHTIVIRQPDDVKLVQTSRPDELRLEA